MTFLRNPVFSGVMLISFLFFSCNQFESEDNVSYELDEVFIDSNTLLTDLNSRITNFSNNIGKSNELNDPILVVEDWLADYDSEFVNFDYTLHDEILSEDYATAVSLSLSSGYLTSNTIAFVNAFENELASASQSDYIVLIDDYLNQVHEDYEL